MTPAQILGNTHAAYVRLAKAIRLKSMKSHGQAYGEGFVSALESGGFTIVQHGYVASLERKILGLQDDINFLKNKLT